VTGLLILLFPRGEGKKGREKKGFNASPHILNPTRSLPAFARMTERREKNKKKKKSEKPNTVHPHKLLPKTITIIEISFPSHFNVRKKEGGGEERGKNQTSRQTGSESRLGKPPDYHVAPTSNGTQLLPSPHCHAEKRGRKRKKKKGVRKHTD